MGCDIHAFIEKRRREKGQSVNGKEYWSPHGGQMRLDRNYEMFGQLAGVRSDFEPATPVKGLPDNMAYEAKTDAFLYIDDESADEDGYTSLAKAKEWESRGETIINDSEGKPFRVSHPDWHTHSWLTAKELKKAIRAYDLQGTPPPPEWAADYRVVLATMQAFEKLGYATRLVFWFDN
jgi:hypothetical protein